MLNAAYYNTHTVMIMYKPLTRPQIIEVCDAVMRALNRWYYTQAV